MTKKAPANDLRAKHISPSELYRFIEAMVAAKIQTPTMIWGPPGVGKSSIVAQAAAKHGLGFVDVRLSQLAPLDLRGLPRILEHNFGTKDEPVIQDATSYVAPRFLPRTGKQILFLDEINMAPPAMMGLAQQLLLDRRMGDYELPDDVIIMAAGNRKSDGASVNNMPTPVANRMQHLTVRPDVNDWTAHAIATEFNHQIVAFINFRQELLHKMEAGAEAWPSPRSWEYAARLHTAGLETYPAVGVAAAAEFEGFTKVYQSLPEIEDILRGKISKFPSESSARYAVIIGLAARIQDGKGLANAMRWVNNGEDRLEWSTLMVTTLMRVDRMRAMSYFGEMAMVDPEMSDRASQIAQLTTMS